jgi:putative nucleotidyltransferase with HDIG domain
MIGRVNARRTLGVLIDWTVDSYQRTFLSGVLDFVRHNDLSCVCFEGGALNSPLEYEAQRNIVYDLPGRENVDGLVIHSAAIGHFSTRGVIEPFIRQFTDMPVVSVCMEIPGVPAVLADNVTGLRELVVHLMEVHQARRFALILGPRDNLDARERYDVITRTLEEYGITVDPRWIYEGAFTDESGVAAAQQFLTQGLDRIDAVMAINDTMALGALDEFSRHDRTIMDRLLLTGFDDIDLAAYAEPTLTTVRLPIHHLGWTSAKLLSDLIEGRDIPLITSLPSRPVIRESCRCPVRHLPASRLPEAARHDDTGRAESPDARHAFAALHGLLTRGLTPGDEREVAALCAEIGREPSLADLDYAAFERLLSGFWAARGRRTDKGLSKAAQDICFHAILDLGKKAIQEDRERVRSYLQETKSLLMIRELLGTLVNKQQMDILAARLPDVGITDCHIALFFRDSGQAVALLAYHDGRRTDSGLGDKIFPAKALVSDDYLSGAEARTVLVKALKEFGFIVFAMRSKDLPFLAFLSDILSGALQAAEIFDELRVQKNGISRNLSTLRQAMAGFIQTMSATVETRDPYTAGHQKRVSNLARSIAQEMGLSQHEIEGVRMAGLIHDLGKIYVPSEILNRSGLLDDIEFSMIKRHPQVAYDILKNIDFPWPIAEIVYQHHERMNGSGYPKGLAAGDIRLEARILAVADVVEAMASHRPYREALGVEPALEEIKLQRGKLYDADVVDACIRLFREKAFAFRK